MHSKVRAEVMSRCVMNGCWLDHVMWITSISMRLVVFACFGIRSALSRGGCRLRCWLFCTWLSSTEADLKRIELSYDICVFIGGVFFLFVISAILPSYHY